jgi:hypothetical protein
MPASETPELAPYDPEVRAVPKTAVDMEEVFRRFPTVRQSILSDFDDCELSALFKLKYEGGWSTHPQARGTMFHRVAAECLKTMRESDSTFIPVAEALEIMEEQLKQENVEPRDRVRLRIRDKQQLKKSVIKFANDGQFNVRSIIDIERRLRVRMDYELPNGEKVSRILTGQLDALVAGQNDEAIVLDWKDTWMLPPKRDPDDEDPGVSYHGFFQQRFYGMLVLVNYPHIRAVTLREFYVRRTLKREARITRDMLPEIAAEMRLLLMEFDRAVAAGEPQPIKDAKGKTLAPALSLPALERHGAWKPSPGHHCAWCRKSQMCPLDDDYKLGGGVRTMDEASRLAAVRQQAKSVVKQVDEKLKPFVEVNGPIPVKRAKGRLVLGYRSIAGGKKARWEEYTPSEADRPSNREAIPSGLAAAARASAEQIAQERRGRGGAD